MLSDILEQPKAQPVDEDARSTVLIVDDDDVLADVLSRRLQHQGFETSTATSGKAGLAETRANHPDLIVLDLCLPDIDGFAICEELAEDGLLRELHAMDDRPAVLLVGWMDRYAGVWRAWQQGGDELLMKPIFKVEELHSAIVAALENAAAGVRYRPAAASA